MAKRWNCEINYWDGMDTTPSDPESAGATLPPVDAGERRLHPFSWLFVLISKLRPMLLPILLLLFLGRGEKWELFGALGAVALSAYSLIYSFSFRYRIGGDRLLVREGIFSRTERHVPFARIQNIVQHRTLLHRLFAVTELRLESAGGSKPEAVMSVITAAEAKLIEQVLRGRRAEGEQIAQSAVAPPLHRADLAEIVRFGLCSNRGAILVGAAFAAASQLQFWERPEFKELAQTLFGTLLTAVGGASDSLSTVLAIALGLLAMVVLLKLLSVVMAVLSHYDFRLDREDQRIGTEAGLLTRSHASANLNKVQRVLLAQPWLARRMHRRSLSCEIASGQQGDPNETQHRLRYLVPMGTEAEVAAVIEQVAPGLHPDGLKWHPLHSRAWRRRLLPSLLLFSAAAVPATLILGPIALLAWLLLVCLALLEARGWAKFAGYAFDGQKLAFRAGWLSRKWTVAHMTKGQVLLLKQTPFDRRRAMASVRMDTAGASSSSFALKVPYLDYAQARELFDQSSRAVAATADPTSISGAGTEEQLNPDFVP